MPAAQVTEVVDVGRAAERVVEIVIEIAAVHGLTAAGEAAVLVARLEEAAHARGRRVGVGGGHESLSVEEQPGPAGALARECAGDVGVDGAVPVELGGCVIESGQRRRRDRHLNLRIDSFQPRADHLGRVGAEQQVADDVGLHLIGGAPVGFDRDHERAGRDRRIAGGLVRRCRFGDVEHRRLGHPGVHDRRLAGKERVDDIRGGLAGTALLLSRLPRFALGVPVDGQCREFGVAGRRGIAGDLAGAVQDRLDLRGRREQVQNAHAIIERPHPGAPLALGGTLLLDDGLRRECCGELFDMGARARRGLALGEFEGRGLVQSEHRRLDRAIDDAGSDRRGRAQDLAHVGSADPACLEGLADTGEVRAQGTGIGERDLDGAAGHPTGCRVLRDHGAPDRVAVHRRRGDIRIVGPQSFAQDRGRPCLPHRHLSTRLDPLVQQGRLLIESVLHVVGHISSVVQNYEYARGEFADPEHNRRTSRRTRAVG